MRHKSPSTTPKSASEPLKKAKGGGKAPASESATKDKAPARPRGRPSKFTPETAEEICQRLSDGEPLRQICRDEHMPNWSTVYDWMAVHKEFSQRIAHAREKGEEAIAQECLDIADNATNDWMETQGGNGAELYKLNGEHIQRSKLRIETRLKLLAKWNPRKWGEKVDLNHGVQPENPLAKLFEQVAGSPLRPKDAGE